MSENVRRVIRLSEIPPGQTIPEGVDVINDYPTSDVEKAIRTGERMHLVSLKKSGSAKKLAVVSLALSLITLAIVLLVMVTTAL